MRILLADDHTLIRENLGAFLKILDPDVEVFEAAGLKEADAIAAREPNLDLIILDLMMPGMDGPVGVQKMVNAYPDVLVVVLSGADGRDNVIVCIEDTGIGISKEDQEIIFNEFRQVDSSYSRRYEGTGLGLALSKKFVELHSGRLWVESEEGKGSRFYFSLPKNTADQTCCTSR